MAVDPAAAAGFSQGAEAYARGRPGYAPEALDWLVAALRLSAQAQVLDLAAGTGKLTAQLVQQGFEVVAVEPLAEMRAQLSSKMPNIDTRAGTAEQLPLADAAVDAVFCGEAFHWFDASAALLEIARTLRPSGGLALLWNRPQFTDALWGASWGALIAPHVARTNAAARWLSGEWQAAFGGAGPFGELTTMVFDHVHRVDRAGFVAQTGSMSFIASLPGEERAEVLAGVAALAEEIAGANADGEIELRYRTEAHWARPALAAP
ncbi:MAG: class I SAM-dependent methyltransferase [Solirubrobacteraceae bacterium]|nr:MAG: SAM-dependent methyltransferase [Solirubrobacterales bacterium]